ncbi:MAG: zeta toxin family protein [Pirellulales bacterium]|nr:zeta toxin family protein [Pirellulales bacterium]
MDNRGQPMALGMAGPNGAGKTTITAQILQELQIATTVNADAIAQGLAGTASASVAFQAGRIMLTRIDELVDERQSFAFETTLSGLAYARKIQTWIEAGYGFHLVFVYLESPELAIQRVGQRVLRGGHDIRRRYLKSIRNFCTTYQPLASSWILFDNSLINMPRLVANGVGRSVNRIDLPEVWNDFLRKSKL